MNHTQLKAMRHDIRRWEARHGPDLERRRDFNAKLQAYRALGGGGDLESWLADITLDDGPKELLAQLSELTEDIPVDPPPLIKKSGGIRRKSYKFQVSDGKLSYTNKNGVHKSLKIIRITTEEKAPTTFVVKGHETRVKVDTDTVAGDSDEDSDEESDKKKTDDKVVTWTLVASDSKAVKTWQSLFTLHASSAELRGLCRLEIANKFESQWSNILNSDQATAAIMAAAIAKKSGRVNDRSVLELPEARQYLNFLKACGYKYKPGDDQQPQYSRKEWNEQETDRHKLDAEQKRNAEYKRHFQPLLDKFKEAQDIWEPNTAQFYENLHGWPQELPGVPPRIGSTTKERTELASSSQTRQQLEKALSEDKQARERWNLSLAEANLAKLQGIIEAIKALEMGSYDNQRELYLEELNRWVQELSHTVTVLKKEEAVEKTVEQTVKDKIPTVQLDLMQDDLKALGEYITNEQDRAKIVTQVTTLKSSNDRTMNSNQQLVSALTDLSGTTVQELQDAITPKGIAQFKAKLTELEQRLSKATAKEQFVNIHLRVFEQENGQSITLRDYFPKFLEMLNATPDGQKDQLVGIDTTKRIRAKGDSPDCHHKGKEACKAPSCTWNDSIKACQDAEQTIKTVLDALRVILENDVFNSYFQQGSSKVPKIPTNVTFQKEEELNAATQVFHTKQQELAQARTAYVQLVQELREADNAGDSTKSVETQKTLMETEQEKVWTVADIVAIVKSNSSSQPALSSSRRKQLMEAQKAIVNAIQVDCGGMIMGLYDAYVHFNLELQQVYDLIGSNKQVMSDETPINLSFPPLLPLQQILACLGDDDAAPPPDKRAESLFSSVRSAIKIVTRAN